MLSAPSVYDGRGGKVPYPGAVPRPDQGPLLCRPQWAAPLDVVRWHHASSAPHDPANPLVYVLCCLGVPAVAYCSPQLLDGHHQGLQLFSRLQEHHKAGCAALWQPGGAAGMCRMLLMAAHVTFVLIPTV
jgi:hypothetical protein